MFCEPKLNEIKILGRDRDKMARELLEAFHIRKIGGRCVSDTSVKLWKADTEYLDYFLLK